jgi:hypothetical protein
VPAREPRFEDSIDPSKTYRKVVRGLIGRVEAGVGREGAGWQRDAPEVQREIASTERERESSRALPAA